ncbi:type II toxin-antitoxin system HipA family toxin [Xylophilus rhododendri]|uniref:Type II toxin-antitoxin system HipA family toxin n=1 Tax=Xylophilus rhododendri TaxID=2697032 RepID=A0A857J071_9BURK|nr:type II toxin-antitoxin system HipA family toxin [Xylophilus rhododendri]QHI96589.1 type II toxin-antitoxin system HipA family toxin [Xylophilus rhododendri]
MARAARKKPAVYRHVDKVDVFLWDQHIGAVALDPAYGYYAFAYTEAFKASGIEPSPLHMPARGSRPYLFTELPEATYKRLPALLSDALPDDFGNALINRYMADRGIASNSVTPLDRLAYMSGRGMGALSFKPARGPATRKPTAIELSSLVEEARKAVSGHVDDDDHANAALRSIIEVGTSAGGARAKAVVAWNPETQEIRAGQLDAPPGFQHWLLKFDGMGLDSELGSSQHYGRIEYAYHLMARAAGLQMSDCRLLQEHGRAHFMTRRFDRGEDNSRHHMQTLCALSHLDYKKKGTNAYAQLFMAASALGLPYEAMEEAFRRMVFNVLARNCDDHSKNFSFRLRQGQAWELAPAYDVTFAHNPQGEWTNQHLMSVNGRFKGFEREDLLAEARRFGVGSAPRVIEEVAAALQRWPEFAAAAELPPALVETIGGQFLDLR